MPTTTEEQMQRKCDELLLEQRAWERLAGEYQRGGELADARRFIDRAEECAQNRRDYYAAIRVAKESR